MVVSKNVNIIRRVIVINSVILIGRVAKDIDLKFLPSGMAVAKFTLAVDKELYGDKKQEAINQGKPTADFINISVFGKSAENCANYLDKGKKVAIQGRISTGSYTTQSGEKRYTTEIVADRVEFLSTEKKESKKDTSVNDFLNNFPDDDNDIFQPVDDSDLIPF